MARRRAGTFDRVYRVAEAHQPVDVRAFDALEARLGHPLPMGYRAWLEHFGEGTYCDVLHPLPPDRVVPVTERVRARLARDFRRREDPEWLCAADAPAVTVFAVTDAGAMLLTSPRDRTRLTVLEPDHPERKGAEDGFFEPLDWRSRAGQVREPPSLRFFEPWKDRLYVEFEVADETVAGAHTALLRHVPGAVHVVTQTSLRHVFLLAHLGAIVRLWQARAERRVRLRIEYDAGRSRALERLAAALSPLGFEERGRGEKGRPKGVGGGEPVARGVGAPGFEPG